MNYYFKFNTQIKNTFFFTDPIDGETSTLAKDLEQVQRAIRGESRASLRPTR